MTGPEETIAYCHACGAAMDVSSVAPFSNVECPKCAKHTRVKREFGPYTLMRRHAIGGMSMVFVAHDNTLDREVALKILSEEYSADERRIEAFEEEARLTASFSHPHVVRVLTTGRAFGRFYIAMELVPGGHFEHQIRERGKIPELEMLPLAIEVAQGLKAAHAAGLIHRDVKPGNILLDSEGRAKLVDFGLALVTQGGKAQAKELWATPYYVPPETVEGHAEDFRSDIYAFGATLYHALSGKPSCGEESMATDILREAKKRVVPLSGVDASISAETCRIVEKAMGYHPNDRFSSYDEMIAALAVSLSHLKSGRSEPIATAAKRRAEKKRKETVMLLAAVGGVFLLAGVAYLTIRRDKPAKDSPAGGAAVESVPPPVVADTAVAIATNYREARAAVESRDYRRAAAEFTVLFGNPQVQEPTRTWAGVEAVLAAFLDGRPTDGRTQAKAVVEHVRSLPSGAIRIGPALTQTLDKLGGLMPLPPPAADSSDGGASLVISAMLAGLKDWEQGLPEAAASCFRAVAAVKLPQEDGWAAIYQKLSADYLADKDLLHSPVFHGLPEDKAACDAAIEELESLLPRVKTYGRARFNVRAWQLDITRHAKLMEGGDAGTPSLVEKETPTAPGDGMVKFETLCREFRFAEAAVQLKERPGDTAAGLRTSLLAMVESSCAFLADIEDDLARAAVSTELPLKEGGTATKLAMGAGGELRLTMADGSERQAAWRDFTPDALISLHRLLVKNPKSELERFRRHECAVAFDWLVGKRDRAVGAAEVLARESAAFRQRWQSLAVGLPK